MNLYTFHNKPEVLLNYEEAHEKMPFFILKRYTSREDYREREEAFTHDAEYAYKYAKTVKRGRFPEGENAIAESILYSRLYAQKVIRERFKKGEQNMIDKMNINSNDINTVLLYLIFLQHIGDESKEVRAKYNEINCGT